MSKLLSFGGFGCVFYPAFNCSGKILSDKYVSKIQRKNFNSNNEITISFFIKKLYNYEKYFLPIISSCNLNLRKINKTNIEQCKLINNVKSKNYISLKLKYFDSYKIIDIYKYLVNTNSNIKLSIFLFNSYRLLLEGLIKLYSLNIIHFDLKSDNILFDKHTFYPKIIDFGISIQLDHLNKYMKNYFYTFSPEYYLWSLEIHFINFLLHEKDSFDMFDIQFIINKYYNNKYFNKLDIKIVNLLKKQSINFYSHYIDKKKFNIIHDLLKYNSTWDNYSLSILFLIFIDEKEENIFNLLLNNISNPNKRFKLDKTLEIFNNILSELDFENNTIFDNNTETFTEYINTIKNFDNKILNNIIKN